MLIWTLIVFSQNIHRFLKNTIRNYKMEGFTTASNIQTKSEFQDLIKLQDDSYLDQRVEELIVKKVSTVDEKETINQELFE